MGDNMFNRKFSSNIRRKKRMIILTIILLVVFLSTGYAAFTTNLGINGTLNVSKYDQTLYGVLKKAVNKGYAREYTGEHQDSISGNGTEKIYYWYAPNNSSGDSIANEILDKNNVIFADYCWQMIRTTDTGGVKMIYNGEAENGQCLNNRSNHVGYYDLGTTTLSSTYYYGTNYEYSKANNLFTLTGTTTGSIREHYYTCKGIYESDTCSQLYYVLSQDNGTSYNVFTLNNNVNYSIIGKGRYNYNISNPTFNSYTYNNIYKLENYNNRYSIRSGNNTTNSFGYYYYSNTVDYGNITSDKYTLINPQTISSLADPTELIGKYVYAHSGNNPTAEIFYIIGVNGTQVYYYTLTNGRLDASMVIGNSYTNNGNGTYTINSPTTVTYEEWYNGDYSNYKNKYICDGTSATCTNIRYSYYVGVDYYDYWGTEHTYKFSDALNYNNGTYSLAGDIVTLWDLVNDQSIVANHRYTCLNNTGICSIVNYIHSYNSSNYIRLVKLEEVTSIEDALHNMLAGDGNNPIESPIKQGIDAWYKKNLTMNSGFLEDAIFCNDRYIRSLGNWDPSGPITYSTSTNLRFKADGGVSGNLACANETDRYSVGNTKAKLTYPIAIPTYQEMYLLSSNIVRLAGSEYVIDRPVYFSDRYAIFTEAANNGALYSSNSNESVGIRPVISLAPGTKYDEGNGSMDYPYVIYGDA